MSTGDQDKDVRANPGTGVKSESSLSATVQVDGLKPCGVANTLLTEGGVTASLPDLMGCPLPDPAHSLDPATLRV